MRHAPEFVHDPSEGMFVYDDGDVRAVVAVGENTCDVLEFSSSTPKMGHGAEAVRWLCQRCGSVGVVDPGDEIASPEAFGFWRRLVDMGLVVRITEPDILRDGRWVEEEIDESLYPDLASSVKREVTFEPHL